MHLQLVGGTSVNPLKYAWDDVNKFLLNCEVNDLYWLAKKLSRWNEYTLRFTTLAITYWAARAIACGNREEVGNIRSLIRRLQDAQPLKKQETELAVEQQYKKWDGVAAVLDAHIHILDNRNGNYV